MVKISLGKRYAYANLTNIEVMNEIGRETNQIKEML